MKIVKINQQPVETLTQPVNVSDVTFVENGQIIESSQLPSLFPDVQFPGDFLSDRLYTVSEKKSPEQIFAELKTRNDKVISQAGNDSNDIQTKIARIEKEIASFQTQKDKLAELQKAITDKETQQTNITQLLSSSQILIDSRTKILEKVSQYKSKVDESQTKTSQNILDDRRFRINRFLKSVKKRSDIIAEDKPRGIYYPLKVMFIITLINFVINFFFYITSFQFPILLVLILSLTLLLFNSFVVNIFRPFYSKDVKILEELVSANASTQYKFNDDDHILLNTAWFNAYQVELARLDDILSQNLQGKDYKTLESELALLGTTLESDKQSLAQGEAESLSIEEYYKKRRELDILKIELENVSPTTPTQSSGPTFSKETLPFIIFNQILDAELINIQNDYITVVTPN